ncbi:MAG: hypothetical protein NC201_04165 [Prevotella sp.]|nr:hypothetical protein [Bacteroides sp.]MCM1366424.1 hypothetical protein [Prevotella sp.]
MRTINKRLHQIAKIFALIIVVSFVAPVYAQTIPNIKIKNNTQNKRPTKPSKKNNGNKRPIVTNNQGLLMLMGPQNNTGTTNNTDLNTVSEASQRLDAIVNNSAPNPEDIKKIKELDAEISILDGKIKESRQAYDSMKWERNRSVSEFKRDKKTADKQMCLLKAEKLKKELLRAELQKKNPIK